MTDDEARGDSDKPPKTCLSSWLRALKIASGTALGATALALLWWSIYWKQCHHRPSVFLSSELLVVALMTLLALLARHDARKKEHDLDANGMEPRRAWSKARQAYREAKTSGEREKNQIEYNAAQDAWDRSVKQRSLERRDINRVMSWSTALFRLTLLSYLVSVLFVTACYWIRFENEHPGEVDGKRKCGDVSVQVDCHSDSLGINKGLTSIGNGLELGLRALATRKFPTSFKFHADTLEVQTRTTTDQTNGVVANLREELDRSVRELDALKVIQGRYEEEQKLWQTERSTYRRMDSVITSIALGMNGRSCKARRKARADLDTLVRTLNR